MTESDYTIRTYTYCKGFNMPDPNHKPHQVKTTGKFNKLIKSIKASIKTSSVGTKGSLMTVFELPSDELKRLQKLRSLVSSS